MLLAELTVDVLCLQRTLTVIQIKAQPPGEAIGWKASGPCAVMSDHAVKERSHWLNAHTSDCKGPCRSTPWEVGHIKVYCFHSVISIQFMCSFSDRTQKSKYEVQNAADPCCKIELKLEEGLQWEGRRLHKQLSHEIRRWWVCFSL